ncbi:MAG TPA: rhodanese-like domain-containing protein [Nitrospirota bacterium]|nr:rhodanese-like domain-containing protein [Nitrospirota bacterium]
MNNLRMKRFLVVLAAIVVFLCGQAYAAGADLIVDSNFVKDKLGKPGWVLVDVRFAEEYSRGHIPGAVGLPAWVSKMFAEDTKRQATVIPRMEKMLGEMGIGNDSHVIIYGDPANVHWNTVMFWVLEAFGCNSNFLKCTVQFYDGGADGWKDDGGTFDQAAPVVKPATFKAASGAKRGAKTDEMVRITEGKEKRSIIIDVRSANEYNGTDVRALRGGHMPRAINIDFAKNFDPATFRMLPLDQLQSMYKDIPKNARVITHCQTGQRASYTYLVLRALGYQDVANYHDGWRVYGSDLKLPVEDETWYDFNKVNGAVKAVKQMQEKMK